MNKVCQNCHQPNPSEAAFCLNCAAPLSSGQTGGQLPNQPYNQPHFGGQPAGQNFAQPPTTSGGASQRANTALILAIAGLFCCGPLTSIPAIVVGWMEIDAIKKGQSSPNGKMFAQMGIGIGIAAIILQGGGFLLWILLSMMAASNPYGY